MSFVILCIHGIGISKIAKVKESMMYERDYEYQTGILNFIDSNWSKMCVCVKNRKILQQTLLTTQDPSQIFQTRFFWIHVNENMYIGIPPIFYWFI